MSGSNYNPEWRWLIFFNTDNSPSPALQAGESFWTDGCYQRCECHAPNDLRCSPASCSPAQQCTIKDGQLGCYDAMSTCTVWGDPHYITFDGALAHFQGTCSYIITESVYHNSNETQFKVVATNNHRGNNLVSFVSVVDIYLSNQQESVHIRIGPNNRVKVISHFKVNNFLHLSWLPVSASELSSFQVNGSEVSPPTTTGTLAQVTRQGSNIVLDAADFIVQFDGRSILLVRMGQHRGNRVTGMCGNFNSDPTDDKVLPNGTLAQTDNEFGHGWKSSTSQPGWAVMRNSAIELKVSLTNHSMLFFLDVDPQMKMAMDWITVPFQRNILNSAASSPTPVVHSVFVTCTRTHSHFSLPVSMISVSTLQPMGCCALLSQPMRELVLFWDLTSLNGVLLWSVVSF